MANVQAPYSEGYTVYRSYWDAHISDLSFTFKIPVEAILLRIEETNDKSPIETIGLKSIIPIVKGSFLNRFM